MMASRSSMVRALRDQGVKAKVGPRLPTARRPYLCEVMPPSAPDGVDADTVGLADPHGPPVTMAAGGPDAMGRAIRLDGCHGPLFPQVEPAGREYRVPPLADPLARLPRVERSTHSSGPRRRERGRLGGSRAVAEAPAVRAFS